MSPDTKERGTRKLMDLLFTRCITFGPDLLTIRRDIPGVLTV